MYSLIFLVVFPLLIAFLALAIPRGLPVKRAIGVLANAVLCAVPVYLLASRMGEGAAYFRAESHLVDAAMLVMEVVIAAYIIYVSVKSGRYLPVLLVTVQSVVILALELGGGDMVRVENNLFVDQVSILMALIVGCIGGAICLYALGYMPEFHHHHREVPDRRSLFAFLMYLFLAAMFGIVFSNNLIWIYFFWEVTTLCSFLLIGYKGDQPSQDSAFKALNMNLIGGVAFAIGLVYLHNGSHVMELDKVLRSEQALVLLPAVCIAFAGLAKSAQFPFSSWLTGAMVAPTPVSALLHSSTMVKAGVYIILRVAPVLQNTSAAKVLTLIGGVSFLITALIAISQRNAKKVLAYSTISNLGLIVACAGVGTDAAVWSALLLILFHAVAKSLLFLCVGIVEYKLGSRDIEDMDYLIMRMPKLAACMLIGMAGMYIAPFGMVIAKFATLKAFVSASPVMAVILAYGSAATLFFWVKWMGKVLSIKGGATLDVAEDRVSRWEWTTLGILASATVAVCVAFPFIAFKVIDPYLREAFGQAPVVDRFNVYVILVLMFSLWIVFPLGLLYYTVWGKGLRRVATYLGGGNIGDVSYEGAMGTVGEIELKSYYMARYFGEDVLFPVGVYAALTFVFILFGVAAI
ncbi:MAG: proton-conducting transporter membrane subunit [bacterium]